MNFLRHTKKILVGGCSLMVADTLHFMHSVNQPLFNKDEYKYEYYPTNSFLSYVINYHMKPIRKWKDAWFINKIHYGLISGARTNNHQEYEGFIQDFPYSPQLLNKIREAITYDEKIYNTDFGYNGTLKKIDISINWLRDWYYRENKKSISSYQRLTDDQYIILRYADLTISFAKNIINSELSKSRPKKELFTGLLSNCYIDNREIIPYMINNNIFDAKELCDLMKNAIPRDKITISHEIIKDFDTLSYQEQNNFIINNLYKPRDNYGWSKDQLNQLGKIIIDLIKDKNLIKREEIVDCIINNYSKFRQDFPVDYFNQQGSKITNKLLRCVNSSEFETLKNQINFNSEETRTHLLTNYNLSWNDLKKYIQNEEQLILFLKYHQYNSSELNNKLYNQLIEKYPKELLQTQTNLDNNMINKLVEKWEYLEKYNTGKSISPLELINFLKKHQSRYWNLLIDPKSIAKEELWED